MKKLFLTRGSPWPNVHSFFCLALLFYLFTRMWHLLDFPCYFFTDEVVNAVRAEELINNGFRDNRGNLLPAYFSTGDYYNISLGVYLQVLVLPLLGKSEWLVRGLVSLITVFGAVGVAFLLKDFFRIKSWWSAPLWLAATPTWFLHSRTAFEVSLTLSFYPWFLYFYFRYLDKKDKSLYLSVFFGILTFYSYSAGQVLMAASGLGFLLSNFKIHLQTTRLSLLAALLTITLLIPYARYRVHYPDALKQQISAYQSYLGSTLSWPEKGAKFLSIHLSCFEPSYWFKPDQAENIRHQIKGRANLIEWSFPFLALGLLLTLFRLKNPYFRCLLILLLIAPVGTSLVGRGITRALPVLLPAILLTCIGWEKFLRLPRLSRLSPIIMLTMLVILVLSSLKLLNESVKNGSRWYDDYGLYGLQWGAPELLGEKIPNFLKNYPEAKIHLSTSWTNGPDILVPFYNLQKNIRIFDIEYVLHEKMDFPENSVFILHREQFTRFQGDEKFSQIKILDQLNYPDGSPGFYFITWEYAHNFDQLWEVAREEQKKLLPYPVEIRDRTWQMMCQAFDGEAQFLFNGNTKDLLRGKYTNPFVIELTPPTPEKLSGLTLHFYPMVVNLKVSLTVKGSSTPIERNAQISPNPENLSSLKLDFDIEDKEIILLRLECLNPIDSPTGKIHLTEIELHPLSEPNK
jgi:hypothetical protein